MTKWEDVKMAQLRARKELLAKQRALQLMKENRKLFKEIHPSKRRRMLRLLMKGGKYSGKAASTAIVYRKRKALMSRIAGDLFGPKRGRSKKSRRKSKRRIKGKKGRSITIRY